ncbi:DUF6443 domain-containing protein [Psychroserpens luteolus]|uniref:DUF6443 domain-containing protein n=1 Tax=Psychroserpens luteolus TaxID=2855840 RepID=UPI001E54E708|nr:DUF6443 domain-containing protein [Psychroserpens luteolus]MCD2257593.1 RHS repeat-associated core domain-containing protein [Psychroserpens luteolus]
MKNFAVRIITVCAVMMSLVSYGQELPEVIPPSPTVSSLMHFEEVPVDYYSGQPNIQFPIYSKSIGSNVTIPIVLRYNTLGLRLDERSGWTGTGWSLDGEIVISRTVRGIRDEAMRTDNPVNKDEVGIHHNNFSNINFDQSFTNRIQDVELQNFLWNSSGKGSGSHNGIQYDNYGGFLISDGAYDKEPDLYQLSLLGSSARFIMLRVGNTLEVKMLSNDSNLKVIPTYNNTTYAITSFTITDTNGVNYILDVTETNTNVTGSESILQNDTNTGISSSQTTHVSAWKVREIRATNNELLATYSYQNVLEEFSTPISFTEHTIRSVDAYFQGNPLSLEFFLGEVGTTANQYQDYNASVALPKRTATATTIEVSSKKLSSIVFNRDGSQVNFLLGSGAHPEYLNNSGKVLEEIEILDQNGADYKSFDLIYGTIVQGNRLFLESVKEYFPNTSSQDFHTYDFAYKDKHLLPSIANNNGVGLDGNRDLWGYYKVADPANSPIVYALPDRSADKDAVTTGVLESITYPTGGKKEFNFESNTFSHRGSRPFTDAEFKMYNPDNWNLGSNSSNAQIYFNNNDSSPQSIITSSTFTITDQQVVEFIPDIDYQNANGAVGTDNGTGYIEDPVDEYLENIRIALEKDDGNGNFNEVDVFSFLQRRTQSLEPGDYRLTYVNLTLPGSNQPLIEAGGTLYYKSYKLATDKVIYGGGLRIKSISFLDSDDSVKKRINYDYNENSKFSDSIPLVKKPISSGVIDGFLTNYKEYIITKSHLFNQFDGSGGNNMYVGTFDANFNYSVKEYLNSAYVSMTKGNYVGYRNVNVYETNGEEPGINSTIDFNGRTVYQYTTPADHPTERLNYGWPFFPNEDQSYLHGLLVSQRVYDKSGLILKETKNSYHDPIKIKQGHYIFTVDDPSCAWTQIYQTYKAYLDHFPDNPGPGMDTSSASNFDNCVTDNIPNVVAYNVPVNYWIKDLYYSRIQLKDTQSKEYFYGDNGTQSIKESLQSFTYEPTNYQVSEQISSFKENGLDVEYKTNFYYPVGISYGSTPGTVKNAMENANMINTVLETQTYRNNIKTSETNTVYGLFNGLPLPSQVKTAKGNDSPEKRIEFHNYDTYGNPLEVSKASGIHMSYIWGYDKSFPVAKAVNTTYATIESVLGTNFNLGGTGLSSTQKSDLKTLVSSAQWMFYDYNPMIGVTNTEDARGYEMSYEYDDFYRLYRVKDASGYILSENEYYYGLPSYVKTTGFKVETTTGTVNSDQKMESITYLDGLGRPIQAITKQAGGNKQDIMVPSVYDDFGRQTMEYLPYANPNQVVGTANLNFRDPTTLLQDLEQYYHDNYIEDRIGLNEINAYSEKTFDASPLNRVIEQAAPGNDWKYDENNVSYITVNTSIENIVDDMDVEILREMLKDGHIVPLNNYDFDYTYSDVGDFSILSNQLTLDINTSWGNNETHPVRVGHLVYINSGTHVLDDIYLGQLKDTNNALIPYHVEINDGYLEITSTNPKVKVDGVIGNFTYAIPTSVNVDVLKPESTNHTIKFDYQLNSEKIAKYSVIFPTLNTEEPQLYYDGEYSELGELYKTITKDENWYPNQTHPEAHTTEEFTNSMGQVILKRSYDSDGIKHDTQYVYDDFGNLTYVLSPKGNDLLTKVFAATTFTDIEDYKSFVPLDKKGNLIAGGDGDVDVIVDATANTITVDFNMGFSTSIYLKQGAIFQLSQTIPDMVIGTILGGNYTVSIQDGYLFLAGSGNTSTINESIVASLPTYLISNSVLEDLCYQYRYDQRNRLVEKKIPQKGWEYIVYDKLDRPMLTQDALQRAKSTPEWLFTKYDAFDRVAYTGIYSKNISRSAIQSTINASSSSVDGSSTSTIDGITVYYSNNVYPTTNLSLHSINYYDTYNASLTNAFSNPGTVFGEQVTSNTKSLPTGSMVRVLDNSDWITTVSYYDDKAQPIYVGSENTYLNTEDVIKSELDFTSIVTKTESTHTKGSNAAIVVTDRFTYDHANRLLTHKQQITGEPEELIVKNTYDELGQLRNKDVGNEEATPLQSIAYNYNIRGWLTHINNPDAIGNDLFSFKINYNTLELGLSNEKLFNGNISETIWKTANDPIATTRGYAYEYDALNRILSGNMAIDTGSGYAQANGYHLNGLQYDKNGNIKSLQRTGETAVFDNLIYTYTGNQLLRVKDLIGNQQTEGFIDGYTGSVDYEYDDNGNMVKDRNKSIPLISYNHLNLPTQVKVNYSNTEKIDYIYDATGLKLKKVVDDNGNITTTEYAGNYIYENSVLKFFSHPEGYVEPNGVSYEYVYQYKDHLGNIRLSYSDPNDSYQDILDSDLTNSYNGWVHNGVVTSELTNGTLRVDVDNQFEGIKNELPDLTVAPGDVLDITLEFDKGTTQSSVRLYFQELDANGNHLSWNTIDSNLQTGTHVYTYTVNAANKLTLRIDKDNTNTSSLTSFYVDHVSVTTGALEILEENNYYPFGLKHKGYNVVVSSNSNSMASKYKYNGKELEEELGKDTYSYGWRDYDPALGRFNKIDRFAEKYQNLSSYAYAANNPIRYIDIKGDSIAGLTKKDARRTRRLIRKNFKGKNRKLRKLFKTSGNGFQKISNSDLNKAMEGVDREAAILARAYAQTINSNDIHRVETVKRKDKLSKFSQTKTAIGFMGQNTGERVDALSGGAITALDNKGGTLTVIVMDSQNPLGLLDTKTNTIMNRKLNLVSTAAHEILGHGVGIVKNSPNALQLDAVQMENLSLRVQGLGRYQRNEHADNEKENHLTFTKNQYSGIPTFFN